MSLPLRTVDLTSLQRHTANPAEVTSFIANWYQEGSSHMRTSFHDIFGRKVSEHSVKSIQNYCCLGALCPLQVRYLPPRTS